MTESCRQGALRGFTGLCSGIVLAVSSLQSAFANPLQIAAKVDETYSDNVRLQNDNPTSDLIHRLGVSLDQETDPGICNSSLGLSLGFKHYQKHTYGDQTETNGHWNGNCQLRNGLGWSAQDNISQVTLNTAQASTPNNQTRRNFFSTGPQYLWLISPRDQLRTSAEYQKTNYSSGALSNARHYVGSSTYTHQVGPNLSVGLGGQVDQGKLDNGETILTRSGNLQFNKSFATTRATGSIGYSRLTDSNNGLSTHNSGVVWNFRLERQLNDASSWYADYGRELTDTTSRSAVTVAGLNFNLVQSTAVRVTHWRTGINKRFFNGGNINLTVGQQISAYLQSGYTEKSSSASVTYTEPVSTYLTASLNLGASHDNLPEKALIYNTYSGSIGLDYRRTKQLTFKVNVGRNQRAANIDANNYKEDWLLIGAVYRFE